MSFSPKWLLFILATGLLVLGSTSYLSQTLHPSAPATIVEANLLEENFLEFTQNPLPNRPAVFLQKPLPLEPEPTSESKGKLTETYTNEYYPNLAIVYPASWSLAVERRPTVYPLLRERELRFEKEEAVLRVILRPKSFAGCTPAIETFSGITPAYELPGEMDEYIDPYGERTFFGRWGPCTPYLNEVQTTLGKEYYGTVAAEAYGQPDLDLFPQDNGVVYEAVLRTDTYLTSYSLENQEEIRQIITKSTIR